MPPLRRFSVKKGVPSIPKDAVLARAPREQFPHVIDSDEGKELLAETEPAELRRRFGCWINDAKTDRHAIFYYMGPDADGHVAMRGVPAALLRSFFDDVSHDWLSFESTHAPPCADGDPLFDPRFVSYARKIPTKGDYALAAAAAVVEEATKTQHREDVEMEAAAEEPPTPEEKQTEPDNEIDALLSGSPDKYQQWEARRAPKKEAPAKSKAKAPAKPKAKASAKPKAKAPAKPKAETPKPDGGSDLVFVTDTVFEREAEAFRASQAFDMVKLWNGDVPANGIIPGSGMAPIIARTGKIVGIAETPILCNNAKIVENHRGARPVPGSPY